MISELQKKLDYVSAYRENRQKVAQEISSHNPRLLRSCGFTYLFKVEHRCQDILSPMRSDNDSCEKYRLHVLFHAGGAGNLHPVTLFTGIY